MCTHTMVVRTWNIIDTLETVDQSKYEIII